MGKAKRYKTVRADERSATETRQAKRRRRTRWALGIVGLIVLAIVAIPLIGDAMKKDEQPAAANSQSPAPQPATAKMKVATIETTKGAIVVELNGDKAPNTVKHISELMAKGFYDGLVFHRVCPNETDQSCSGPDFGIAQGGDPKGDGSGGSGQTIKFETNDLKHERGAIAMARSQSKDSADSQFYFVKSPLPSLDGQYVVFGKITAGLEVLDTLVKGDKMTKVTVQ